MANYDALKQAVIDGNAARVKELTQQALDAGDGPQSLLDEALIPAMDVVGEKFSNREFFIPEMLIAARAMQAGLGLIKPLLTAGESRSKGKVVIGTVKGDLHDIGKNLVGMMLQGAGFEVVDLGADVKPAKFVEAVQAQKPDFIMMSALLTTTMLSMKDTMAALKEAGLRDGVKVGVGGAPVTQRFADEIGADFYAPDATGAVGKAKEVMVG
jgi:5-methyltetrahydrofolate--homocysteine methyltransferase